MRSPVYSRRTVQFTKTAGGLSLLIGLTVLAGWTFGIGILESVRPGWDKMAPTVALCVVLGGLALLGAVNERFRLTQACAGLIGVLALLGLSAQVTDWNLGLDRVLFKEPPGIPYPARMSPLAAFDFLLFAGALFLVRSQRSRAVFQASALLGGLVAWLALTHYIYGGLPLFPWTRMAVHTAASLLVLNAGLLSLRIDGGLMALLVSETAGGLVARTLAPGVLLFPLLAGSLVVQGQRAGWYATEAGVSLLTLANVVFFGALFWRTAVVVQRGRRFLGSVIGAALDGIVVIDHDGRIVEFNPSAERIFGYRRAEVVGRRLVETIVPPALRERHRLVLARFFATGKGNVVDRRLEMTGLRADGSEFPVELSIAKMPGDGPPSFTGFLRDITGEKRAVEALRESEERFRTMADSAPVLIWVSGTDKLCTWFNQRWLEFVGRPMEAELGSGWAENVHPDDFDRCLHIYTTSFDAHEPFTMEYRLRRHDGEWRWVLDHGVPHFGPDREFAGYIGTCIDITARKEAEQALRESQQLLQAVFDNSAAVIYVKDLEGRYLLVNRCYYAMFPGPPVTVIGKTDFDLFPREAAEAFRAMDRRVATAGAPLTEEESAVLADGLHTYLSVKSPLRNAAGETYAVFGISTDITDRKRAEQALRESQEHYRALAESLPHLVWTCLPEGPCDYLSRQWVEYTGRPAEEQLGYGWAEHLHPDDRPRVEAAWAEATRRGDHFDVEFRLRRADGAYRWFKTRAVPLRDASGRIVKWFGSNTDAHDYKRAEQRLRTQLARMNLLEQITRAIGQRHDLRSVFQVVVRSLEDNLPVDFGCICLYDHHAGVLTVTCLGSLAMDAALTEQEGLAVDQDGLARCVRGQLVYEPDIASVPFPFPQRLARAGLGALVAAPLLVESQVFGVLIVARRERDSFSSGECEFLKQLSEHVALAARQAELHEALQAAYDGLRQTQQAVVQQERLRALGQMASGIAHDINNAISPVALYMEWLLEQEPNVSPRARSYLEITQRAIDDVAHTVARMREFYRPQEPQLKFEPVHLNDLVEQVVDLTRARWSDMPQQRGVVIDVRIEPAAELPAVAAIESELREALTNLVFNAVDAMPAGGTITIRTAAAAHGAYVEVVDTGVGMDEYTRRQCLEPFFTTKGERGTGLGLAMVYGVVQRHGGELQIESAPGQGTAIRLAFPPATGAPIEPLGPDAVVRQLRILVVDDDPLVINSLRDTLEADGHIVTTAGGGQQGIDAFRAADRLEQFDVVVTDLGMPYVDGHRVADAVKAASPSTPVILLTGWGQRLVAEGEVPDHVDLLLNKPPKLGELRKALARFG